MASLYHAYELLQQKVAVLWEAKINETDPLRKHSYEFELQKLEEERNKIEAEIDRWEAKQINFYRQYHRLRKTRRNIIETIERLLSE